MVLILLVVMLSLGHQSAQAPPKPPNTVRIDGNEHPERIPDHWLWRATFLRVQTLKQQGDAHPLADLTLSATDANALFREAALQPGRDEECRERLRTSDAELRERKETAAAIRRAYHDITIDCRTKDLDAADRVLDTLSPEGRALVEAWLDRRRRSIVAFVPEQDIEMFKLPR